MGFIGNLKKFILRVFVPTAEGLLEAKDWIIGVYSLKVLSASIRRDFDENKCVTAYTK
jgi:hypothetical protein